MKKRNKIMYWISTIWLAVAMLASGVQQIFQMKSFVDIVIPLGYPLYFLTILGAWKVLGVIAILIPGYTLVKEWAYAGFFYDFILAMFAEIHASDGEYMSSSIALTSILISYIFWKKQFRIEFQKN